MVLVFTFVKLCPDLQSLWVNLWLWIKSVVIYSLDHRPHHTKTPPPPVSPSAIKTLSHQPITGLSQAHTSAYHEEREREREREREILREKERTEKEGWTSGWPCTATFFHLHLLQSSKKRERERETKRWISLLLTTMQLLLQHAQEASAPLLSAGLQ